MVASGEKLPKGDRMEDKGQRTVRTKARGRMCLVWSRTERRLV